MILKGLKRQQSDLETRPVTGLETELETVLETSYFEDVDLKEKSDSGPGLENASCHPVRALHMAYAITYRFLFWPLKF